MNKKKFNLSGAFAIILALLILIVFVPINMIFGYYDKVFDMTPSGKYTLNPITEQLVEDTADKQIDIYFLATLMDLKDIPTCLPLYHTLTELESKDNITLTCFDPNEDTELAESLNPTGLLEVGTADIFVKCGDTIKQIKFNRCFQTDSNGILEYAGEELIAGAIELCTSGNLPTVYFLTGYGDTSLEENYSIYKEEIMTDNYDVKELDLSATDKLPENTAIIYLVAPQKDITDSDREKLSNYIDNGGAISMILPPCETSGRFENIEYLLAKFELAMDYNIVREKNSDWQYRNLDSEQDDRYFRVSYPTKNEEYSEDLTTDINQLITDGLYIAGIGNARSFSEITSDSELIEKYAIIENLPTSADSYEYTAVSEPMGGDSTTANQAKEKSNTPLAMGYYSYNKQTGAKLYLIGSDDSIDNDRVTISIYGTRMLTLFSNTWLSDSDIDMGIGTKSNSYDTMVFEDGVAASKAIRLFIIVPIIFALAGVAVWLKRRYA
ncbi:MAG: GldG family protein [Ruminococcus flavefaciens]|nr:GldG family protein [Ruminococcus flavefaciens]MCM1228956.1 GldG family protein [Ruminococcus flavefaciens]